jgi:hypothetical protein
MDSFFTLILILFVCYKILYVKFAHMGRVLVFNVGKLDGGYVCYMGWVQDSLVAMEKTLHMISRFWGACGCVFVVVFVVEEGEGKVGEVCADGLGLPDENMSNWV